MYSSIQCNKYYLMLEYIQQIFNIKISRLFLKLNPKRFTLKSNNCYMLIKTIKSVISIKQIVENVHSVNNVITRFYSIPYTSLIPLTINLCQVLLRFFFFFTFNTHVFFKGTLKILYRLFFFVGCKKYRENIC